MYFTIPWESNQENNLLSSNKKIVRGNKDDDKINKN